MKISDLRNKFTNLSGVKSVWVNSVMVNDSVDLDEGISVYIETIDLNKMEQKTLLSSVFRFIVSFGANGDDVCVSVINRWDDDNKLDISHKYLQIYGGAVNEKDNSSSTERRYNY